MSRRRRLVAASLRDSGNSGTTSNEHRRGLLDVNTLEDHFFDCKKRTTVHPNLTNYGPESLQCFLREESEKLNALKLEDQRKHIIEFARSLVDSPDCAQILGEYSRQSIGVVPLPGDDESFHKVSRGKGKEKSEQQQEVYTWNSNSPTSLIDTIQESQSERKDRVNKIRKDSGQLLRRTTRFSSKPNPQGFIEATEETSDDDSIIEDDELATIRPWTNDAASNSSHNVGLNENISHRAHASSWKNEFLNGSQSSSLPERPDCKNDLPIFRDTESSGYLTTQLSSGTVPVLTARNAVLKGRSSPQPGVLTRAASFENHAELKRDFRRSRDEGYVKYAPLSEESRRPRKIPVHSPGNSIQLSASMPTRTAFNHTINEQAIHPPGNEHSRDMKDMTQDSARASSDLSHILPPSEGSGFPNAENEQWQADPRDRLSSSSEDESTQSTMMGSLVPCPTGGSDNEVDILFSDKPLHFEYRHIVPEVLPKSIGQASNNRCMIWRAHGYDRRGQPNVRARKTMRLFTAEQLDPHQENVLNALDQYGDFRRVYAQPPLSEDGDESLFCWPPDHVRHSLPHEIWEAGVLDYLSSDEVRNLRLVCKGIAEDLEPFVFRNVVTKFGPSFTDRVPNQMGLQNAEPSLLLRKFGPGINKFGISFEYDKLGMISAPHKTTQKTVKSWFGDYNWPVKEYPYFAGLKEIDMLTDEQPRLLIHAFKHLTNCHELALSIDSGHGWMEGPDMSDLAVYRDRAEGGAKVFGKTFGSEDKASKEGMVQLFDWAQRNTINESIKHYERLGEIARDLVESLKDIAIRSYDSYHVQLQQPDFEKDIHTGRKYVAPATPAININAAGINQAIHTLTANQYNLLVPMHLASQTLSRSHRFDASRLRDMQAREVFASLNTKPTESEKHRPTVQPQWPLIFNGYNLAAEVGGAGKFVQGRLPDPAAYPLSPGSLTEAQAQWIMETSWIQRTFLTSYMDAIRTNSSIFRQVHSLHLRISSGMISSLSSKPFWSSLPQLRSLSILVKPDWRSELAAGDKYIPASKNVRLLEATSKFTEMLRDNVARTESLDNLHIGYSSGGEHQKGLFGRNQHILPAPIVTNPRMWILGQNPANTLPSEDTMIVFPHIRGLTFENCFFTPLMLETFMSKSRDSSLHHLKLDSVSLTAQTNSTRADGPLRTHEHRLACAHPPGAWLQENIPANASWVNVLDKISPGRTIQNQRYDAGMINEEQNPRPESEFRGNIQTITLKSCGYVKILQVSILEFNQNDLVFHDSDWHPFDEGLRMRATRFNKTVYADSPAEVATDVRNHRMTTHDAHHLYSLFPSTETKTRPALSSQCIMQGAQYTAHDLLSGLQSDLLGSHPTGYLTQCIHPIEKSVLEQNWGMKFGWGDDMRRWEAVEDGWFMGGTGRFSGKIFKDSIRQDEVNTAARAEEAEFEAAIAKREEQQERASKTETVPAGTSQTSAAVSIPTMCYGFADQQTLGGSVSSNPPSRPSRWGSRAWNGTGHPPNWTTVQNRRVHMQHMQRAALNLRSAVNQAMDLTDADGDDHDSNSNRLFRQPPTASPASGGRSNQETTNNGQGGTRQDVHDDTWKDLGDDDDDDDDDENMDSTMQ